MYQMQNRPEWDDQPLPQELHQLLTAYREALPDPDPSAAFMPELWAKIDARRSPSYNFSRLAKAIVAAAAAICVLLSLLAVLPSSHYGSGSATYIDVLSNDHPEDASEPELAHLESL